MNFADASQIFLAVFYICQFFLYLKVAVLVAAYAECNSIAGQPEYLVFQAGRPASFAIRQLHAGSEENCMEEARFAHQSWLIFAALPCHYSHYIEELKH